MKYLQDIRAAHTDPERLENLYRAARRENAGDEWKSDLLACHAESPDNILYTAWRYRLQASGDRAAGEPWRQLEVGDSIGLDRRSRFRGALHLSL